MGYDAADYSRFVSNDFEYVACCRYTGGENPGFIKEQPYIPSATEIVHKMCSFHSHSNELN